MQVYVYVQCIFHTHLDIYTRYIYTHQGLFNYSRDQKYTSKHMRDVSGSQHQQKRYTSIIHSLIVSREGLILILPILIDPKGTIS